MRRTLMLFVPAVVLGFILAGSPSAYAYGDGAGHDMWQVGLSGNCNNPSVCGDDALGGFWGWVEFDRAGTQTWGDAELTGCSHLVRGDGGGSGGAIHIRVEIESWTIEAGSAGPTTFFASGEETYFFSGGTRVTEDVTHEDTGIPAMPGHYSTADLFGFTAPGVAFQVQVAFRPAR